MDNLQKYIFDASCGKANSSGKCCRFFNLGNGVGLKLYESVLSGGFSYVCQKIYEKYDLAPKVYGYIFVNQQFGYLTEIGNIFYRQIDKLSHEEVDIAYNLAYDLSTRSIEGLVAKDLHEYNFGAYRTKDGIQIKVTDFSAFVFEHNGTEYGEWNWGCTDSPFYSNLCRVLCAEQRIVKQYKQDITKLYEVKLPYSFVKGFR